MITTVTLVHLLLAVLVILLTFFQDSKSESLGGGPWGGAGSQSLFGPIGATTFIQKATWWLVALLAVTSLSLAHFSNKSGKSVLDKIPVEAMTPAQPPAQSASSQTNEGTSAADRAGSEGNLSKKATSPALPEKQGP